MLRVYLVEEYLVFYAVYTDTLESLSDLCKGLNKSTILGAYVE